MTVTVTVTVTLPSALTLALAAILDVYLIAIWNSHVGKITIRCSDGRRRLKALPQHSRDVQVEI